MKALRKAVYLFVLLCFSTGFAQNTTCADIVQDALDTVQNACSATGRNQACYGNISMQATPREGVTDFAFEQQGDLVNVGDLQTLRLRQLDLEQDIWGVALMQIQANLPDALPGQNVTFLLFGDVEIENAGGVSSEGATLEATSNGGANIRTSPSTNGSIAGSLSSGEKVIVNGISEDGLWLRIQIPDSDSMGWVFAQLFTVSGDVDSLTVIDTLASETTYQPMQAFYFRTGIVDPLGCAEAPSSGLLIQTPDGAGEITLRANDVDIQLGSTAYLQAVPGDQMTISVIEGEATVTAMGETVVVPAGASVGVLMDEEGRASDAPKDVEPYNEESLVTLPIIVLPREIEIAPAADEQTIADAQEPDEDSGGIPGVGLPGGILDFTGMEDIDPAIFCTMFDQIISSADMSLDQYISLIRAAIIAVSPADRAEIEQFITLLEACP